MSKGGVVSGILLVGSFFMGRNAVWDGTTLGLIMDLGFGLLKGDLLYSVVWGVSIGTFTGFAAELLGRAGGLLKKEGNQL